MSPLRLWMCALVVLLAAVGAGCGSSASSPHTGPASGQVYELDTMLGGRLYAHEWYAPSSGDWASRTVGRPGSVEVFTGGDFWSLDQGTMKLERGSRAWLSHTDARPGLGALGVAVASAWFHPASSLHGRQGVTRTGGPDGGFTLHTSMGPLSDSSTTPIPITVTVHAPISAAQAAARGAFRPPPGRPDQITQEGSPGAPSHFGVKPYWFGGDWRGRAAAAVFETSASKASLVRQHETWTTPTATYAVVYRTPGQPGASMPSAYPSPAVGDATVRSMPRNSPSPQLAESGDPVIWYPATLADGEHAQVTVYDNDVIYVRTASTMVVFSGEGDQADCSQLLADVGKLRPVGDTGASGTGSVDMRACDPNPAQPFGMATMQPAPANGVPAGTLPGSAPVPVLTGCPKTSPGLTPAALYPAAQCSPELRNVPYDCFQISNVRTAASDYPWYASADLGPGQAAPPSCPRVAPGIMLFGDRVNQGYALMFIARHPVCGPVTGPTGRVEPVVLYELMPTAYRPACP